jgi:RimJ/RimL family protein N-acetyltransferase
VLLRDGTNVEIRPIRPDDRQRLRAAYERLSPASKYRRFLAPKPHLSSRDVDYLVAIDGADHVALVATLAEDPERIVGVGRFVRLPEAPDAAEVAVVVGDTIQGEGLGGELLDRLALEARARGIGKLRATMLADNAAAHGLLHHLPGRIRERNRREIDEIEVELAT